jgi:hypothetical protein
VANSSIHISLDPPHPSVAGLSRDTYFYCMPKTIPFNRFRIFLNLLGYVAISTVAISICMGFLIAQESFWRILGGILFFMSMLNVVRYAFYLSARHHALEWDEHGITISSLTLRPIHIPWTNVDQIMLKQVFLDPSIVLTTHTTLSWRNRVWWFDQIYLWLDKIYKGQFFCIPVSDLKLEDRRYAEELSHQLTAYKKQLA